MPAFAPLPVSNDIHPLDETWCFKMMKNNGIECLAPDQFRLCLAADGRCVKIGPEQYPVPLPAIPLPVHLEDLEEGEPADEAIGRGVYDYLRQFPDCPLGSEYVHLLQEAYDHYLGDLAAQIVMLNYKDVDPPYVRRQIAYMKILLLLDPGNIGLLQQLGKAYFEVALNFSELQGVRYDLLKALGYLQKALGGSQDDPATLNYIAQIDYWLGDYPSCGRRWQGVFATLGEGPVKDAIAAKLERLEKGEVPDHPLVDDLEGVGNAMAAYGRGEIDAALMLLEGIEEDGTLLAELPMAEFYYLLGICRERTGERGGAFDAYDRALQIDPNYEEALRGRDRIAEGNQK